MVSLVEVEDVWIHLMVEDVHCMRLAVLATNTLILEII